VNGSFDGSGAPSQPQLHIVLGRCNIDEAIIIISGAHHQDSSDPGAIPNGSSLPRLLNDTAQATTESKPRPAVASRGLLPEPRRNLRVSQRLNEVKTYAFHRF
jgi:hypothetical protein